MHSFAPKEGDIPSSLNQTGTYIKTNISRPYNGYFHDLKLKFEAEVISRALKTVLASSKRVEVLAFPSELWQDLKMRLVLYDWNIRELYQGSEVQVEDI